MKLTNSLVIFDLETTGVWIKRDKIIEIAMIKCQPDGQREEFYRKINPTIPIPKEVSKLIGIGDDDVKDEKEFKDIAQDVLDFVGDADFAGFNVERFDLPLLERELKDAGLSVQWENRKIIDVQKIYHQNAKRDLTAAYKFYCQKELDNAHSAMSDTEATLEVLEKQAQEYLAENEDINGLLRFDYKVMGEFYDSDKKFRWWNGKLYMMFGKYAHNLSLQDVVKKDKGYLEWILSADFSEEVKLLVENALNGQFPVYDANDEK